MSIGQGCPLIGTKISNCTDSQTDEYGMFIKFHHFISFFGGYAQLKNPAVDGQGQIYMLPTVWTLKACTMPK